MERTLEFRVWDKRDSKMRPVTELFWSSAEIVATEDAVNGDVDISIPWDEYAILMQSTGLKDKNGKEIYEGDVVTSDAGARAVYVVEFKTGAFGYAKLGAHHLFNEKKVAVLGNIYENPNGANPMADKLASAEREQNWKQGYHIDQCERHFGT